jgi:hypothetical protein
MELTPMFFLQGIFMGLRIMFLVCLSLPLSTPPKDLGHCVISIEVQREELSVPPLMTLLGVTLTEALENPLEPQALLSKRIEPAQVKIVHCDDLK